MSRIELILYLLALVEPGEKIPWEILFLGTEALSEQELGYAKIVEERVKKCHREKRDE